MREQDVEATARRIHSTLDNGWGEKVCTAITHRSRLIYPVDRISSLLRLVKSPRLNLKIVEKRNRIQRIVVEIVERIVDDYDACYSHAFLFVFSVISTIVQNKKKNVSHNTSFNLHDSHIEE